MQMRQVEKGHRSPASVFNLNTADDVHVEMQGCGVGHRCLVNGDRTKAREAFERIAAGLAWTACGHLAAEADLRRSL